MLTKVGTVSEPEKGVDRGILHTHQKPRRIITLTSESEMRSVTWIRPS